MNDEQICDFYLRAKEANLTFEKIAEAIKLHATNFICFDVVRNREVNVVESILDSKEKLNWIYNELSGIRNALERIADSLENHGTLTLKVERCFDPSDDEEDDDDENDDDGWAITDANGRVVDEGDYE